MKHINETTFIFPACMARHSSRVNSAQACRTTQLAGPNPQKHGNCRSQCRSRGRRHHCPPPPVVGPTLVIVVILGDVTLFFHILGMRFAPLPKTLGALCFSALSIISPFFIASRRTQRFRVLPFLGHLRLEVHLLLHVHGFQKVVTFRHDLLLGALAVLPHLSQWLAHLDVLFLFVITIRVKASREANLDNLSFSRRQRSGLPRAQVCLCFLSP